MSKKDILKHVDILDLVNIVVTRVPFTANFDVQVLPLDQTKQFIIDTKTKVSLEEEITQKASALNAADPKAKMFIEEFVARMIRELYAHGLCALEEVPDAPLDPYADLRKRF